MELKKEKEYLYLNFASTAIHTHIHKMEYVYLIRLPEASQYKGYVYQSSYRPRKVRQNKTYFLLVDKYKEYEIFKITDGVKESIYLTGEQLEQEFESWKYKK